MNVTSIIALILSVASLAGQLILRHACAAPAPTPQATLMTEGRGVGSEFVPLGGTGGRGRAQDMPEIVFQYSERMLPLRERVNE